MSERSTTEIQTQFERLDHDSYFIRRPNTTPGNFEETYWGEVTDPDGNMRIRSEERDRFLSSVQTEISMIAQEKPGRILDIGCGLGFFLSGISQSWERHGVEISVLAADHARRWSNVHTGSLESAQYPDQYFDVVVLHHVIEHVEDPCSLILETRRIIAPNGMLVFATPDFDSGCARHFGSNYRLLHDQTHISLFSNESARRFLRDFGFRIEHADFPFFRTPYFTEENLRRMRNTLQVSPAFYGNFMTFYCRPESGEGAKRNLLELRKAYSRIFGEELDGN